MNWTRKLLVFRLAARLRVGAWLGIFETAAVVLTITLIDYSNLFSFEITEIQPHPFWIPVILAASFYGRLAGCTISLFAAAADATLHWSARSGHLDFYEFMIANSVNLLLWLAAAAVLGRFREKHLDKLRQAEQARDRRAAEANILADRCRALAREASALEHRIAASGASAGGAILEVFDRVLKSPAERVFDGLKAALDLLIGAKGVELYLPTEFGWQLSNSDAKSTGTAASQAGTSHICDIVANSDRVYSWARVLDRELLNGYAAAAAPVRSRDGQLLGIVVIREIDAACLNHAGEAAISLGNFILGTRYLETGMFTVDSNSSYARLQQLRSRLQLVRSNVARKEAQS